MIDHDSGIGLALRLLEKVVSAEPQQPHPTNPGPTLNPVVVQSPIQIDGSGPDGLAPASKRARLSLDDLIANPNRSAHALGQYWVLDHVENTTHVQELLDCTIEVCYWEERSGESLTAFQRAN